MTQPDPLFSATHPKLTPSVQRACGEAVQNAHLNIPSLVIDILQAALKDPNDPDWLARQLFVLNNTHDGTTIPRWTPEQALKVWNELADDAWVRLHYRMVADGLRILITGEPV